ncbi:ABC transporter permease [Ochrobactrum sp. XJ1]|nr:ABC transporter permease [Ochrobactrum sp. XJ1]
MIVSRPVLIFTRLTSRLFAAIPPLVGVVIVTFLLMRVLPGDPAVFFASGPNAGEAEIQNLREELGLDKPLLMQLGFYFRDILTGNLGHSVMTGQPVVADMAERLPASLELTVAALVLALVTAIPLGIIAALRSGSFIDHLVRLLCTFGVCVPTFVSGLMLIYLFYVKLGWAPDPSGRIDPFALTPPAVTGFLLIDSALAGDWESWWSAATQLVLPAGTMALFVLAPLTRMTRASMLAALGSEFIRTARSLGLPRGKIVVTYALRNALLPVLTIAGIVVSSMLGANVLVEKVFSWPGVASYAVDALVASDYAPVQGFVLLMACIFVVVNLIIDLLYGLVDPRVSVA